MARSDTINLTESWRVLNHRMGRVVRSTGSVSETEARLHYQSWDCDSNENIEIQRRARGQSRFYPVQQRISTGKTFDWVPPTDPARMPPKPAIMPRVPAPKCPDCGREMVFVQPPSSKQALWLCAKCQPVAVHEAGVVEEERKARALSAGETANVRLLVDAYGWTNLCKRLHVGDSTMWKALNHRTMRADTLQKFRVLLAEELAG